MNRTTYDTDIRSPEVRPYVQAIRDLERSLDDFGRDIVSRKVSVQRFLDYISKSTPALEERFPQRVEAYTFIPSSMKTLLSINVIKISGEEFVNIDIDNLGSLFALSYALDSFAPTKVMPIMSGARAYAGVSEFFGFPVSLIEAHKHSSERFKDVEVKQLTGELPTKKDRILLLEDDINLNASERTYQLAVRYLLSQGVPRENIGIYLGRVSGLSNRAGFEEFPARINAETHMQNHEKLLTLDRPYFWEAGVGNAPYHRFRLLQEIEARQDLDTAVQTFKNRITGGKK